jgi:hypothetical protein
MNGQGRIDKEKIAADLSMGDAGREDSEIRYRKLAKSLVEKLWVGEPLPASHSHAVLESQSDYG